MGWSGVTNTLLFWTCGGAPCANALQNMPLTYWGIHKIDAILRTATFRYIFRNEKLHFVIKNTNFYQSLFLYKKSGNKSLPEPNSQKIH